ncbi:hypothetical protein [Paenibacillus mendelii]|uniref:Uncharacterized protein n=1 Tax=Paenibacillus mendelii TaxID=206163 RepID=A0ABV6JLH4_9BACL|nr:hypothetical protein [Paenibacillus mendelii]MCQ6560638.1 hypothetical protein [Paenibacillus mendelii]
MIEWIKYDPKALVLQSHTFYLVTDGSDIGYAYHARNHIHGYLWRNKRDELCTGITHYAEVNLPCEE